MCTSSAAYWNAGLCVNFFWAEKMRNLGIFNCEPEFKEFDYYHFSAINIENVSCRVSLITSQVKVAREKITFVAKIFVLVLFVKR